MKNKEALSIKRRITRVAFVMCMIILLIFLIVQALYILFYPHLGRRGGYGAMAACKSCLGQIGKACQMYAVDHNGEYPSELNDLISSKTVDDARVFTCPKRSEIKPLFSCQRPKWADRTGEIDYIYLQPVNNEVPESCIMAFDEIENHEGKSRNVLFMDCHVEWMYEKDFQMKLKEMLTPEYKKYYFEEAVKIIKEQIKAEIQE